MNHYAPQQYDSEEVTRIIRRALKLNNEDTISHDELMETAGRMGLDCQIVETAIRQEQRKYKKQHIRQAILRRRKAGFQRHLWSYLAVNIALLLTNKLTAGPWWFHWSVLGWGIGLAFHFKAIYFHGPKGSDRRINTYHGRAKYSPCET
jgi:hypothetical protein